MSRGSGWYRWTLAFCFFCSGMTGLAYELLWSRHLQLFFGSTTEAVGVVLAVFLGGLGAGGAVIGKRVDRSADPLSLYGRLEVCVGGYALLTDILVRAIQALFLSASRALQPGPAEGAVLKALLSAAAFFVPCFLLGGTLPALAKAYSDDPDVVRKRVGVLYGLNTLGAILGTVIPGFLLIETLGHSATMTVSGLINVCVGLLALAASRVRGSVVPLGHPAEAARAAGDRPWLLGSGAGFGLLVSGLVVIAYEIVFTRVLGLVFGVSSYAFTAVLAVFLLGLALGSLLSSAWASRRALTPRDFARTQLLLAAVSLLAYLAIPFVPSAVIVLRQMPEPGFWEILAGKLGIATAILLPLATCAGLGTPILLSVVSRDREALGRSLGDAYLVNTVGTVLGSLATSFLLIRLLGTAGTFKLLIATSLVTWGALSVASRETPAPRAARLSLVGLVALVVVGLVAAPRWPFPVFLGPEPHGRLDVATSRLEVLSRMKGAGNELLFFEEGRNATVAVTRNAAGRSLMVNGHADASDADDMPTQFFIGALPALAHPGLTDALVIGLGSGVTVDALVRAPQVRRVDVVELEESVVRAAALFRHVAAATTAGGKHRLVLEDARSFVLTTDRRYDAIVSEPSNPWRAGVASLFTADFYASARRVLKPGGLFAQWVQLYGLDGDTLRLVLRTLAHAFPHVEVWWLDHADILVLASDTPLPWRRRHTDALLAGPYREEARRYARIETPGELFSRYLGGTEVVRTFVGSRGPIHTDDLPLLEFAAPRGLLHADNQNPMRLVDAKLRAGAWLPTGLDSPPPAGDVWIGMAGNFRSLHRGRELGEALRRAEEAGAPVASTQLREAEALADMGNLPAAGEALQRSLAAGPPASRDEAVSRALLSARLLGAQGRHAEALRALEPFGAEARAAWASFQVLLEARRGPEALEAAAALVARARPGGEIGYAQVDAILRALPSLSRTPEEAGRALQVCARLADPGLGFPEARRLESQALILESLGRPEDAVRACRELRDLGVESPGALATEVRCLVRFGREAEARELEARVRKISPRFLVRPVEANVLGSPAGR